MYSIQNINTIKNKRNFILKLKMVVFYNFLSKYIVSVIFYADIIDCLLRLYFENLRYHMFYSSIFIILN